MINVLSKPIIQWSIETIGLDGNYIFCIKEEHEKFKISELLREIVPSCHIINIDFQTRGALETVLQAKNLIDNDEDLLISDADHYLDWDSLFFQNHIIPQDIDSCTMIFPEPRNEKKSSYVELDSNGYVKRSAEKVRISTTALVGLHYFKRGSDFVRFANEIIMNNITAKNEFYLSLIYNMYAKHRKKIITYPIREMWPLGDPDEIQLFTNNFGRNES